MAIAVDPNDPATIYLGTLGGVYKSDNGGDVWELKRDGFPPMEPYAFSEMFGVRMFAFDKSR